MTCCSMCASNDRTCCAKRSEQPCGRNADSERTRVSSTCSTKAIMMMTSVVCRWPCDQGHCIAARRVSMMDTTLTAAMGSRASSIRKLLRASLRQASRTKQSWRRSMYSSLARSISKHSSLSTNIFDTTGNLCSTLASAASDKNFQNNDGSMMAAATLTCPHRRASTKACRRYHSQKSCHAVPGNRSSCRCRSFR